LIDANVARLYRSEFRQLLAHHNTTVIEATEDNKSIENLIPVFQRLVANGIRRDHTLVAIGGGIVQDICCFIASTLLRGIPWRFVPTTLLAQADSCIGSKSSINLAGAKNILGTFKSPQDVFVHARFLDTLESKDISSGIGEILKVHAIDGVDAFDRLATDFPLLRTDNGVLQKYVRSALCIKRRYVEEDEFDRGVRNIFNYGHSFGHAIESATAFEVPHGIAVSMGMDIANHIAAERALISDEHYRRMHSILRQNYADYALTPIALDAVLSALMRDKKNTTTEVGLILPVGRNASIQRVMVAPDDGFRSQCGTALARVRE
jgi:3-dehydroquinate synthase